MADRRIGALLGAPLFLAVACASHGGDPAATADRITRAVYANDLAATTVDLDEAAKKQVSRGELGELSDKMHALGEFRSLTPRSSNPDTGRYEYNAAFSNGSLIVQLRMDPSGKVGAYRIVPGSSGSPPSPSTNG